MGYEKSLELDDLFQLDNKDDAKYIHNEISKAWLNECKTRKEPKLSKALYNIWGKSFLKFGVWILMESWLKLISAVFIGYMLNEFSKDDYNVNNAIIYASIIAICSFGLCITHHRYFFNCYRFTMQLGSALIGICYEKTLKLNINTFAILPPGKIFNIISNDVRKFYRFCSFTHFLWVGIQETIIILIILWHDIGVYSLLGFAVCLATIPLQAYFSKKFAKHRQKAATFGDTRIKYMKEMINGIEVIKMNAYEKPYTERIQESRKLESNELINASKLKAINQAIFYLAPTTIAFIIFTIYSSNGNRLTNEIVYRSLALFYVLLKTVTLFIPFAIEGIADAKISVQRIEQFLLKDNVMEQNDDTMFIQQQQQQDDDDDNLSISSSSSSTNKLKKQKKKKKEINIILNDVNASWSINTNLSTKHNKNFKLSNITMNYKNKGLIGIIGSVNAGKSSLLMLLLGELNKLSSTQFMINGNITYCPQVGWIQSGTVRSNILMGLTYNKDKYDQVIYASCLDQDVMNWIDHDLTEIGKRGITLSGGQKARISLARCLYSNADIYLLDDPLSAVDAKVGKKLMNRCFNNFLKDKLVLLVTHQIQF